TRKPSPVGDPPVARASTWAAASTMASTFSASLYVGSISHGSPDMGRRTLERAAGPRSQPLGGEAVAHPRRLDPARFGGSGPGVLSGGGPRRAPQRRHRGRTAGARRPVRAGWGERPPRGGLPYGRQDRA